MQALLPGIVGHDSETGLLGVVTADLVVQDSGVGQAGAGALLEELDGGFFRFVGLCAHDILRGKWRVMNRGRVLLIHIRWGNSRNAPHQFMHQFASGHELSSVAAASSQGCM